VRERGSASVIGEAFRDAVAELRGLHRQYHRLARHPLRWRAEPGRPVRSPGPLAPAAGREPAGDGRRGTDYLVSLPLCPKPSPGAVMPVDLLAIAAHRGRRLNINLRRTLPPRPRRRLQHRHSGPHRGRIRDPWQRRTSRHGGRRAAEVSGWRSGGTPAAPTPICRNTMKLGGSSSN